MIELEQEWQENFTGLSEDWSVLEKVLPVGWAEAARRTGALH